MKFIRLKEVTKVTGLSRSSIYNFMNEGAFPKTVPLGGRAVAWLESEVEEWMEARLQERG